MNRLESLAPQLVHALRKADPRKRLAAAVTGCRLAIRNASVESRLVEDSLALLEKGEKLSEGQHAELSELAAKYDDEYFERQESGNDAGALEIFGRARAVAALVYASRGTEFEPATEAIYEASATLDDPAPLLRRVETVLAG